MVGNQLGTGHASLSKGFTPEECLEGLHFQIADRHAGNKFLQVRTCTCIMQFIFCMSLSSNISLLVHLITKGIIIKN